MNDFIKIKATARSLSQRKLVYGHGRNDADYKTEIVKNGRTIRCPYYRRWKDMIMLCYSSKCHEKQPTYIGCEVCDAWLAFSNFRKWMVRQPWQGNVLDKDLIKQGNKIYAPEYCRFISQALNNLLLARDAARGDLPLGICWDKQNKKYRACISIDGKRKYLGYFQTVQAAKAAYDSAKYADIQRHAMMQDDPLIKAGLLNWVIE